MTTAPRYMNLPVSDCGCFSVGYLGDWINPPEMPPGRAPPKHAILIWYDDVDIAREAMRIVTQEHWK